MFPTPYRPLPYPVDSALPLTPLNLTPEISGRPRDVEAETREIVAGHRSQLERLARKRSSTTLNVAGPVYRDLLPLEFDAEAVVDRAEERKRRMTTTTSTTTAAAAKKSKSLDIDIDRWSFPIFELERSNPSNLLGVMATRVFQQLGLLDEKIDRDKFHRFFRSIGGNCGTNPYHNSTHAADVVHAAYYLVRGGRGVYTKLEMSALVVAAAVHDFDHRGRSNAFLVGVQDPLAVLYNDRSVLENNSVSKAWRVLAENFFLDKWSPVEVKRFRHLLIEMVLSTDLALHAQLLSELTGLEAVDLTREEHRVVALKLLLKAADLNSAAKPIDIHREWSERIVREFYAQGDEERRRKMPVSEWMDRTRPQVPEMQTQFIRTVVLPMVEALAEKGLLADKDALIRRCRSNLELWSKKRKTTVETKKICKKKKRA
jgi:3'5'-cyclic nucleotide phosphodiesterase